jgi:hypothetical protein
MKQAACLLLLALAPLEGHHSFAAEFDVNQPVELRGTVTALDWINPHCWIHLEVKDAGGEITRWVIEAGSPNALLRLGVQKSALPAGTEVVVAGFRAKDGSHRVSGRWILLAGGRKLFLGGSAPGSSGGKPGV